MEMIVVGIAEGKTAARGQALVSYALGSCVGVCLYESRLKIAGMACSFSETLLLSDRSCPADRECFLSFLPYQSIPSSFSSSKSPVSYTHLDVYKRQPCVRP